MTRTATADLIGLPANLTWRDEDERWYTPRILGSVPPSLKRWHGDAGLPPSRQRADVRFTKVANTLDGDIKLILDVNSGEVFELWRDQPCGGGCRCSATIVWRPDVRTLPDTSRLTG